MVRMSADVSSRIPDTFVFLRLFRRVVCSPSQILPLFFPFSLCPVRRTFFECPFCGATALCEESESLRLASFLSSLVLRKREVFLFHFKSVLKYLSGFSLFLSRERFSKLLRFFVSPLTVITRCMYTWRVQNRKGEMRKCENQESERKETDLFVRNLITYRASGTCKLQKLWRRDFSDLAVYSCFGRSTYTPGQASCVGMEKFLKCLRPKGGFFMPTAVTKRQPTSPACVTFC